MEEMNIRAKFCLNPIYDENYLEEGRLIFDLENDRVYFGKPNPLSTNVPNAKIMLVITPIAHPDIQGITCYRYGTLLKHIYSIRVEWKFEKEFTFGTFENMYFNTSKNDGGLFSDAWNKVLLEYNNKIQNELLENNRKIQNKYDLESLIINHFSSSGKVDIKQFTSINFEKIRSLSSSPNIDFYGAIKIVIAMLQKFIVTKRLSGLIDRENLLYTDRDFIVQEQRIVQFEVKLDFNNLVNQLGNKGIILSSIQCPKCGGNCEIPNYGSVFKCKYCGTDIQATDMFEKFRGILG